MRSLRLPVAPWLALLLAGCAGVEPKAPASDPGAHEVHHVVPAAMLEELARAKSCCASLADLPYRTLDREGAISVEIGPNSPAFAFDTGKSYFAAFRLPDWPRPLEFRVSTWEVRKLVGYAPPMFNPALLVLDAQFRVKRIVHEPLGLSLTTEYIGGIARRLVEGEVYIAEPQEEASYLVILTTDELRSRKLERPREIVEGFSPVGTVGLEVHSMPFVGLPVRYHARAWLVDSGPDGAAESGFFSRTGHLVISQSGVHYLTEKDGRRVEQLTIPFANIVAARAGFPLLGDARLELDTAPRSGDPLVRRTLVILPDRGMNMRDSAKTAAIDVADAIPRGWYGEPMAITAASSAPVVEFRERPAAPSGAGGRIGESAMKGGAVTAGVCGICYTGLCGPEMLLPCAGLFAVGPAVGGAVGISGELLSGGFKPPPRPPALPAQQVQAATPAVSSAAGTLVAQEALRECAVRSFSNADAWVIQGRAATLEPRTEAARFVLETAVHRVALVPNGTPDQPVAEIPVELVVEGGFIFRDTLRKREEQRSVTWQGRSYTLAEWSAPDGRVLEDAMRDACDGLAALILSTANPLWRGAP